MWIRTQDRKRLVDIADIRVIGTELCGYPINDCNCRIVLGEYSSKEHALKALDRIQTQLMTDGVYYTIPWYVE